ncbi:hypothetical protein EAX61_03230 [Dokdonia sinensis]|uniref:Uncharacterized protein n=1 Tax=Dokdonia sinensis TaxID=2479847 RepID=A0A3M0GQS4_9FLAO|nr:hypothetical protein EAX61_03230 [Dokdonia sinensis]
MLLLISFITVFAPDITTASTKTAPTEIVTDGLYYAEFYDYIFRGHFEHIKMTSEDPMFLSIFSEYLYTFGSQCAQYLPDNKVEMQKQVCKTESVTTDGYGVETNRYCVEYVWIGSGVYAKPDLYNAKVTSENALRKKGLQVTFEILTDPNAMGNSVDMIHKMQGLKVDMLTFFKLNPCNSPAILAFEENLKRFALNQPAVRINAESKYTKMKKAGGPTATQNKKKLLDDLIKDQSRTWAMNRYVPGSISSIFERKDTTGKIVVMGGSYQYKGFLGTQKNNVRVTFKNGIPECIYFSDYPNNCKTPNSGIVSAFASGKYTVQ